jgi:ABC-type phosphate transport system substrate-binding protein
MRLAIVSICVLAMCTTLAADNQVELVIIAHPDTPSTKISRERLQSVYLKRVRAWSDGTTVRPVDLADRTIRDRFAQAILGKSPAQLRSYWTQQIFSGKAVPPEVLKSSEAVVAFVVANPGAIAYVPANTPVRKAKLLSIE